MTRLCMRAAIVAALLGTPTLALAQTALGSIAGTVRDATGAVLPGVTVEASSPALIEKVRTAQTDGEGRYQITELRPGTYSVTFTLEGFTVVKRDGIELNTGFVAAINADLRVGSVAETITVSGQTPVVDLQNTKQQVVVTRDVIDNVPTGRSFQNLGVLIPGVVSAGVVGSPVNQDVGGGSGQSFMTLGIHGGRTSDQRIDLDGMSTSAWTRPDSSAIVFTDGNIEEYNISVAANSAESETGGVRINLIPREGGNKFTGGFFGNYGAPSLQANNNDDRLRALGLRDANKLKSVWSVNPTVGGPITPDKLWFFATYTYSVTDTLVGDAYLLKDPTAWTFDPDFSKQAVDDQYSKDISTRLTYQASPRNKFAGYLSYNNTCHCHFLIGRANSAFNVNSEASTLLFIPNKVAQITWTSPVTSKLLFELGYSTIIENQQFNRRPESTAPQITDTGLSVIYRGTISDLIAYTPVYGSRGSVSYVTGSHALKGGYTLTMGRYDNTARKTGDVSYLTINGSPLQATYYGTPTFSTNRIRPNLGLYAQDQWSMNRLTVNAGLRLDYIRNDYPDQSVPPTQFVPVSRSFPGQEAVNWKDLNPRLGVSYDLFGNGKTAVKVSANRYVLGEGVTRASTINPITANNSTSRTWTDSNGDRVVQGDPLNLAANGELGTANNQNFGKPVQTFRYDPDWSHGFGKRPYNWEFSTGVQHELIPRVSASVAYFRRIYGNFTVTDNAAVGPADYTSYCVTAPTDPRLPNSGQQICGLYDLNPTKIGLLDSIGTAASKFGNQYEHWNGADFTMNARLARLLLRGGVSTGRTMTDSCDVYPKIDSPAGRNLAQDPNQTDRFCHLQSPFLTQIKMLGALTLPYDIQLSGTYQNAPGPEITALGTYVNAQVLPSLGRNLTGATSVSVALTPPLTTYGDRLNQVDFRFAKKFTVDRFRFQATVDLFNALNSNVVLVQSNNYGATTGASTGSAWQRPQAILPARIVKFGVQLYF
jgi:hypothetical protein